MAEAAAFIKTDLLVNTVLNRKGQIAGLFVGGLHEAHRAGCELARDLFARPIHQQADLVIASAGSAKNYVQSHKALYNAFQALKPGGRILFVAKCEEGLGGEQFAKWIRLGSRAAVIAGLRRQSEINGQTALSHAREGGVFGVRYRDDKPNRSPSWEGRGRGPSARRCACAVMGCATLRGARPPSSCLRRPIPCHSFNSAI